MTKENSGSSEKKVPKKVSTENVIITGGKSVPAEPWRAIYEMINNSSKISASNDYLLTSNLIKNITNSQINSKVLPSYDLSKYYSVVTSTQDLQEEISKLKRENSSLAKEISESKSDSEKNKDARKKYEEKTALLERKEKLSYILGHVNLDAQKRLLEDDKFLNLFETKRSCSAYVVAIDIRRSTELMLKAKTPEDFAIFITELCEALSNIILSNYGIFEKFTGDGILAFFPEYYSGKSAGILAVQAALDCHKYFDVHYRTHRNSFTTVISNVGLGIGIDYGSIHVVNLQNALSIVGVPVVYACRMSGANAGQTLLNQSAYADILCRYSSYFNLQETTIDVKNEGVLVAYNISSNGSNIIADKPDWDEILTQYAESDKTS